MKIDIQNSKDSAAAAPGIVSQISRQIPIIDNRITDPKNQLAAAEREKTGLIAEKTAAENLIRESAAEVSRLQGVLRDLEQRIPSLQRDIAAKEANCQRILDDLRAFRTELGKNQENYRILLGEI